MPQRPHNWDRLKEIVADVLDAPSIDRDALLAELCQNDSELLGAARELVDAYDDSSGVIDQRTDAWLGLGGPDVLSLSGQRIGRYALDKLVGEGGMAAVYKARQTSTDRVVALKLFRVALPLIDAHNRFRREAQALARLTHKNIAAIYEAGLHETADQRALPYIAMEFVDGKPLIEYARHHRLDRAQRIELLITIAKAVQEAHQQTIIHRDLKPANILVDSHGEPKILDFGIARINSESDRMTWQTTAGLLLGTPGYMAPEQCTTTNETIDVRADVWALGVLLYELLTDRLPIDVSNASITEVLRRISTDEPVLPRTVDPSLRGDLETVMMTALSRDKMRRYSTAQAFANDLERFLSNRPIEARPPTTLYLLTKFAKRNKGTITTAVLTTLLILVTTVLAVIGFFKASQERDRALTAEKQALQEKQNASTERDRAVVAEELARADRDIAVEASHRSESVSRFLLDLLRSPDPNRDGRTVTVLDQIRKAVPTIGERFKDSPPAEGEIRGAIGRTLFELAEYDLARPQIDRAVELCMQLEGRTSRDAIRIRAVQVEVALWQGRTQEGKELCQKLLDEASKDFAQDDVDILPIRGAAAMIETDLENYDKAIELYVKLVADHRKVNADHPERIMPVLSNLANAYMQVSRYDEAAVVLNEVIKETEAREGAASVSLIIPRFNLGQNYAWAGKYDLALPVFEEGLVRSREIFGPSHDHTLICSRALADTYVALGSAPKAVTLLREVVDSASSEYGPGSIIAMRSRNSLALALSASGQYDAAIEIFNDMLGKLEVPDMPRSMFLSTRRNLANTLGETGRRDEALKLINSVFDEERGISTTSYSYFSTLNSRGQLLLAMDKPQDAEADLRASADGFGGMQQPRESAVARRGLGKALVLLARYPEAEKELDAARTVLDSVKDNRNLRRTAQAYVDLYTAWQKPEPLAEWKARLDALPPSTQPATIPTTAPAVP